MRANNRVLLMAALAFVCGVGGNGMAHADESPFGSLADWGEALFFDADLSANRTQSCATCHDPAFGFVDPRDTVAGRAVSLGDNGVSLGDRNAPTAAYARFSPAFHRDAEGVWKGGQFHDGRAATLADQAKGPPLDPGEMGMADEAAVAERLWEKPRYRATLLALAGDAGLSDPLLAFDTMAQAIAAFEETETFAPFDSKYDRFLRGEARFTDQEELGRLLFFSEQFTNCNICHQLQPGPMALDETFSNYEFHNIGVPANPRARAANGRGGDHVDSGLSGNVRVSDPAQAGKFKVPTLRNVAVTGPYMHNGVFEDLRTVVRFYNTFNSQLEKNQINPETGAPFGPPEVAGTISVADLEHGPALDEFAIDAIVAFLETLTDARYEHLLEK